MKIEFVKRDNSRRLLLIFAGWGMDVRPFAGLEACSYDVAVGYDYREIPSEVPAELTDYEEICVLAWSFGVAGASFFLASQPSLPVTVRVAVNGTLFPVDDEKGIPEAVFGATLEGLTEASLQKFYRRMCGGARGFREFEGRMPRRDLPELGGELRAIAARGNSRVATTMWDTVWISEDDLIIPAANQVAAWEGHPDVRRQKGPHLPDFEKIVAMMLVDKPLVSSRFAASMATSYDSEAKVQRGVVSRIADELRKMKEAMRPDSILEIGCGSGELSVELKEMFPDAALTLMDIAPIAPGLPGRHEQCDAEIAMMNPESGPYDLVVSASTIQWFNSFGGFARRLRRVLTSGGTAIVSGFGPDNFREISGLFVTPVRYMSCGQMRAWIEAAGLEMVAVKELHEVMEFPTPGQLLEHLRLTGVNAVRATDGASVGAALKIVRHGIKRLTYHTVIAIVRNR